MVPLVEQPPDDPECRVAVGDIPPAPQLRAERLGFDLALDGVHALVVVDQQRGGEGHQAALLRRQPADRGVFDLPLFALQVEGRGIRRLQLAQQVVVLQRLRRCRGLGHVAPCGFGHGGGIHAAERAHRGLLCLDLGQIGHGRLHLGHDLRLHVAHAGRSESRDVAHHCLHLLQGGLLHGTRDLFRSLWFGLFVSHFVSVGLSCTSCLFILRLRPRAAARRSP